MRNKKAITTNAYSFSKRNLKFTQNQNFWI